MTGFDDEEELPKPTLVQRCWPMIRVTVLFASPIVATGCAVLAGYFAHTAVNTKQPADISRLAVSILKSGDASPEMRGWAADALGISADIPMTVGGIKPMPQ